MPLNLNDLINRFYDALRVRFQDLHNAFESILPDPQVGFGGLNFIPLPQFQLQQCNVTWKDFYKKDVINRLAKTKITVDVDSIIGEAIHDRLVSANSQQQPKPYQHQVEAIAYSLEELDSLRNWLKSGTLVNAQVQRGFDVVALLAPTASGKTEVLETITLQVAMDGKRAGFRATKVIMIYPMKEFMKDHIRRFIRDLAFINSRASEKITIGLRNEDTPSVSESKREKVEGYLQTIFSEDLKCPICGASIDYNMARRKDIEVRCKNGHDWSFIKFSREAIRDDPPDILLITPDSLNIIMRGSAHKGIFGINSRGFPLLIVMDEPHTYSGIFGSNVSLLLRELRTLIKEVAKFQCGLSYEPFILVSSATIPKWDVFLSKLLVMDRSRIKSVSVQPLSTPSLSNKGVIALLPRDKTLTGERWGLSNASVELIPLLAALLDEAERKIIVFVDSTERAEILASQIEEYISRPSGFWQQYDVLNNIGNIFHSSVASRGVPKWDFIKIGTLSARMDQEARKRIAEEFRRGKINVLIATSAMEIGVDIGDVNVAVLIGLPPTPLNFEQRVGRIGRRGQPSLVVLLGNESSGVDVYYLLDQNRFIDYIRSMRSYDIPLNPANPYSLRAYVGNFVLSLLWRQSSYPLQKRVEKYEELAIGLPCQVFSSAGFATYSEISRIANYLQSNTSQLKQQLKSFVQALNNISPYGPPHLFDDRWDSVSREWSGFLSSFGLLEVSTPIRDMRTLGRRIQLSFRIGKGKLFELNDDVLLAIATYSLSELPHFNPSHYFFEGELHSIGRRLRGVVTLKPVNLGNKVLRIPFETVGGRFSPYIPFIPTGLYNIQAGMESALETLQLVDSIMSNFYVFSRIKRKVRRGLVKKLKELLNLYLKNVLPDALNEYKNTGTIEPRLLRMARPQALFFRPLEPLCLVDTNNQLLCYNVIKSKKVLENARYLLFYYEVRSSSRPQFVNKIEVDGLSVIDRPLYDRNDKDLIIPTPTGQKSYKQLVGRTDIEIANHVSTYPLIMPMLFRLHNPIDVRVPRNGVQVALRTATIFFMNIGYTVETPISRPYLKFIGRKDKPSIIYEPIETYTVEICINWPTWFNYAQSTYPQFYDELSQDLTGVGITNLLIPLPNIYALSVAHSLAHVLLNFHSLYTGGEKKDLSEFLEIKSEDDKIIETRILLFDTVMGGNGISELLYNHLSDVLSDALKVMLTRHLRARDPDLKFTGEPGDVYLGKWPKCMYGDVALSRLWLLKFLAIQNGTSLRNWLQSPPAKLSLP
jgi:ATP-dependent helicase YprA (DUF1998 family)